MNEKRYNGWTNYETWAVNLWLGNEEGSYRYWTEAAEELVREAAEDGHCAEAPYSEGFDSARYALSKRLQSEIEDGSPTADEASLYADLMNAALSEVNWYEIAEHFIADAIESLGYTEDEPCAEAS